MQIFFRGGALSSEKSESSRSHAAVIEGIRVETPLRHWTNIVHNRTLIFRPDTSKREAFSTVPAEC